MSALGSLVNERALLARLVRSNFSCILVVPAIGRIVAVIEIARAGGSMAVTQAGERRRARGVAAPTLAGAGRRGGRDQADREKPEHEYGKALHTCGTRRCG